MKASEVCEIIRKLTSDGNRGKLPVAVFDQEIMRARREIQALEAPPYQVPVDETGKKP